MKSNRSNSPARKPSHSDNTRSEQTNSEKEFQVQTESGKNISQTPDKPSDKSSAKNDLSWKIIIFILLFSTMITVIGMTTVYLIMSHRQEILISQHTQKNHELMNHQNTLHTQQNNELMNHIRTLQTQTQECPANTTTFETKWTYFSEPKMFADYDCTSLQQFVFSYKNIIPEDKKIIEVKIAIFCRTWQEHDGDFRIRVRSINGKDEFLHYLFMRTAPKDLIDSQSESLVIPSDKTREIRVQSSRVRRTWNMIQLFVIGYKQRI